MRIVVFGAGGFAREVKWLIDDINLANPTFEFVGYVVSEAGRLGPNDSSGEVVGDLTWLRGAQQLVDGVVIGIGHPKVRIELADTLRRECSWLQFPPLVHPTVQLDKRSAKIGAGVIVCASVVATVNVALEPFCLINLACTIGHEAKIGAGSVLNPSVNISGGVLVGEGVLVGTGAQVLQYLRIGEGATIGAGAVVTKDVQPATTVVGIPARGKGPR